MGKALDAEERLHVCFKMITSMMSAKHFKCDLFHFRYLFKIRYNSLRCAILFVVRKQLLCHYFNELSIFVVYREKSVSIKNPSFKGIFYALSLRKKVRGRGHYLTPSLIKADFKAIKAVQSLQQSLHHHQYTG